ncbi:hypothetical protein FTX61_09375 [Nitriliruptoraceae bacterium ZYF776]|nr:hypothetical protein [Profundirhabdus halotolerans]
MSLRIRNVQVDVPGDRYDEVVAFWAAALSASTRPGDGPYVHLVQPDAVIGLHLQRIDEGDARYHLDLEADDVVAEVERLTAMGATHLGPGDDGQVLADPAGLVFCVCATGLVVDELADTPSGRGRLDAFFVDVPPSLTAVEQRFWERALNAEVASPDGGGDSGDGLGGLHGTDEVVVEGVHEARYHLDLSAPDVEEEVERLVALGASRVASVRGHVTLADPVGNLLCVIPRGTAA